MSSGSSANISDQFKAASSLEDLLLISLELADAPKKLESQVAEIALRKIEDCRQVELSGCSSPSSSAEVNCLTLQVISSLRKALDAKSKEKDILESCSILQKECQKSLRENKPYINEIRARYLKVMNKHNQAVGCYLESSAKTLPTSQQYGKMQELARILGITLPPYDQGKEAFILPPENRLDIALINYNQAATDINNYLEGQRLVQLLSEKQKVLAKCKTTLSKESLKKRELEIAGLQTAIEAYQAEVSEELYKARLVQLKALAKMLKLPIEKAQLGGKTKLPIIGRDNIAGFEPSHLAKKKGRVREQAAFYEGLLREDARTALASIVRRHKSYERFLPKTKAKRVLDSRGDCFYQGSSKEAACSWAMRDYFLRQLDEWCATFSKVSHRSEDNPWAGFPLDRRAAANMDRRHASLLALNAMYAFEPQPSDKQINGAAPWMFFRGSDMATKYLQNVAMQLNWNRRFRSLEEEAQKGKKWAAEKVSELRDDKQRLGENDYRVLRQHYAYLMYYFLATEIPEQAVQGTKKLSVPKAKWVEKRQKTYDRQIKKQNPGDFSEKFAPGIWKDFQNAYPNLVRPLTF